jgi:hypothetical protein
MKSDARRRPLASLLFGAAATMCAGIALAQQPPIAPDTASPGKLAGHAAVEALAGNTMNGTADGAPYFAYYDKSGEVRMKRGGAVETGHWAADGDDLCEEYPDDEDETCYKLDLDGAKGVITDEDGTSYAVTILPGNPEKL